MDQVRPWTVHDEFSGISLAKNGDQFEATVLWVGGRAPEGVSVPNNYDVLISGDNPTRVFMRVLVHEKSGGPFVRGG